MRVYFGRAVANRNLTTLKTLLLSVVIGLFFGLVMAIVSNLFVSGVRWLTSLRNAYNPMEISFAGLSLPTTHFIGLFLAAALILLVRRVFNISRWHGPADSIYAAHRTDNELDTKAGFGSTLAAFINASGGASVGQYGPLVHFGATMGSMIRQFVDNRFSTDIFIGCGVAGAIAAGFNAPIAGVVFAHEAILRHFSLRAIAPITISSIAAVGFSRSVFGDEHALLTAFSEVDIIELLPAALISGPVFGIAAICLMITVRRIAGFAASSGWQPWQLIFGAALFTSILGMFVPGALGLGTQEMMAMINTGYAFNALVVLLVGKIILTAICLGMGLYGGIFSPALFVGAATGGIIAKILQTIGMLSLSASSSAGLVICGMAAVAATVIGAPISGVLIILEMTMSYEFAVAAMLSVVTAALVGQYLFGHSFFDRQLLDRGIDISQGRGHLEMMEAPVSAIVNPDFLRLNEETTAGTALKKLISDKKTEAYVTTTGNILVGKLNIHDLINADKNDQAASFADPAPRSIKHDASLQQAMEIASDFVGEAIPIIDRENNRLLGVVTEADLFDHYLSLQNKVIDLEKV